MKFNVQKLKAMARQMTDAERNEIEYREENRDWLAISAEFALTVRYILRTEGLTQRALAQKMDVSASQITKILSGKENLSLQTIAKVEKALGRKVVDFKCCNSFMREHTIIDPLHSISTYKVQPAVIDYASDSVENIYSSTD